MVKKYFGSFAALTALVLATSCGNDDAFDATQDINIAKYEAAFKAKFGNPAPTQTWGFNDPSTRATRSAATPVADNIACPFTETDVTELMATGKELTETNATQNWSGSPDFTLVYNITGTWNGGISTAASEDWGSGDTPETGRAHRDIVVKGTWNVTADQRIGGKGRIIIANGGKVVISEGAKIEMVNQARLIVLPGGELSGDGGIIVNNGNASGYENYNGGTINLGFFNNNFGKFYNNGDFIVKEYMAGSTGSNFYNHHLAVIDKTGMNSESPNARIYNACQFYVKEGMRARIYEGVQGSSLIVGGTLFFSVSADGTGDASYVGLAAGALVKCNQLYNNGTSWSGPTEGGYAVLDIEDKITYMNWQQDNPAAGGYFENNIYVYAGTWDNIPDGNGYHAGETATAEYKMFSIVGNSRGNGNVTKVEKGTYEVIPADDDFVLGEDGCTPGFKIKKDDDFIPAIRIMGEDLSAREGSDFDFNDVVFDVMWTTTGAKIRLVAAGGRLPLTIEGNEVHAKFLEANPGSGITVKTLINTAEGEHQKYNAPIFDVTGNFKDADGNLDANLIKVMVNKGTDENPDWLEMTAKKGKVASKFGIDAKIDWCNEKQDIESKWSNFAKWVRGEVAIFY